jgi:hypothetical protein
MSIFAIVENDLVINVIVADTQEIADEVTRASSEIDIAINIGNNEERIGIGWSYVNGEFEPPIIIPEETGPVNKP